MVAAHYPLQALLYAVALHRYLRWRLPGYDPAAAPGRRPLSLRTRDERRGAHPHRGSALRCVVMAATGWLGRIAERALRQRADIVTSLQAPDTYDSSVALRAPGLLRGVQPSRRPVHVRRARRAAAGPAERDRGGTGVAGRGVRGPGSPAGPRLCRPRDHQGHRERGHGHTGGSRCVALARPGSVARGHGSEPPRRRGPPAPPVGDDPVPGSSVDRRAPGGHRPPRARHPDRPPGSTTRCWPRVSASSSRPRTNRTSSASPPPLPSCAGCR